jgi:hypothetical protein
LAKYIPLFYNKDGKLSRYNLRKFGELPYHLVRCKQFKELYSNVLFNYQWLYSKMSACPLQVSLTIPFKIIFPWVGGIIESLYPPLGLRSFLEIFGIFSFASQISFVL